MSRVRISPAHPPRTRLLYHTRRYSCVALVDSATSDTRRGASARTKYAALPHRTAPTTPHQPPPPPRVAHSNKLSDRVDALEAARRSDKIEADEALATAVAQAAADATVAAKAETEQQLNALHEQAVDSLRSENAEAALQLRARLVVHLAQRYRGTDHTGTFLVRSRVGRVLALWAAHTSAARLLESRAESLAAARLAACTHVLRSMLSRERARITTLRRRAWSRWVSMASATSAALTASAHKDALMASKVASQVAEEVRKIQDEVDAAAAQERRRAAEDAARRQAVADTLAQEAMERDAQRNEEHKTKAAELRARMDKILEDEAEQVRGLG